MKILIVGDFEFEIYEESFFTCFKNLGHFVEKFSLLNNNLGFISKLINNASNKFAYGIKNNKINNDLINKVAFFKPDLIFVYRGRQIYSTTYKEIKMQNDCIKIFYYNNDDFFSVSYPYYFWRHVKSSLKYFDHIFCYREKNILELNKLKYTNISILRSYYIKEYNYQFCSNFNARKNDVVFVGHFENDGRDELLKKIIENGINLKLFGTGWEKSKHFKFLIENLGIIKRLNMIEYNNILNDSKIALVFLSKRNSDSYTRRCFEIPASGCVMLSEETSTLKLLYKEDKEIIFFNSKQSAIDKIKFYLNNIENLKKISIAASERLASSKHEVSDRIKEILNIYYK